MLPFKRMGAITKKKKELYLRLSAMGSVTTLVNKPESRFNGDVKPTKSGTWFANKTEHYFLIFRIKRTVISHFSVHSSP
jgi:hypothetical protein